MFYSYFFFWSPFSRHVHERTGSCTVMGFTSFFLCDAAVCLQYFVTVRNV